MPVDGAAKSAQLESVQLDIQQVMTGFLIATARVSPDLHADSQENWPRSLKAYFSDVEHKISNEEWFLDFQSLTETASAGHRRLRQEGLYLALVTQGIKLLLNRSLGADLLDLGIL
jgi:hypothetical protein